MRSVILGAGLAGAMLVSVTGAADAASLTVTQQNAGNVFADSAGLNAWFGTGDVVFNSVPEEVSGGLFRLVGDDGVNPPFDFVAFCFEFTQFFQDNVIYDMVSIADPTLLARVDALYSNAYDAVTDSLTAAAFQFALWEITEDATLDLSMGNFQLTATDDPALLPLATSYIQNIANNVWTATGGWSFTVLDNPDTQNLIVAERSTEVPLPAGFLLMLTALAGLGGLAYRGRAGAA
jgi:hypothetical protein